MTVEEAERLAEARLIRRLEALNQKLKSLPSQAWAKEATNRKRAKLAAQKRNLEAALIALRQIPLIPKNQRLKGSYD